MSTFVNPRRLVAYLALCAATLSAGCANMAHIDRQIDKGRTDTNGAYSQLEGMKQNHSGAVSRFEGARLSGDEIAISAEAPLPMLFNTRYDYSGVSQTMEGILAEASRRKGISISVQPGVRVAVEKPFSIEWSGNFKGFLDYLTTSRGLYWKYSNDAIYIFKTEARTFQVYLPGGKRSSKAVIGLSGVGGSGVGTVDVSSANEIDPFASITTSIELMVAEGLKDQAQATGGAGMAMAVKPVVPNPALGIITVTSTPPILDRVDNFLKGINDRFAKNVMISVKVLQFSAKRGMNAGISATLAYNNLAKNFGVQMGSTPNLSTQTTPGQLVLSGTGSDLSGSSLVINTLSQYGDVSFVTSGNVVAANGQPSPLQVAQDITYLASSSTVATPNVGTVTTLTPGQKTVGFTANFLPLVLGDNRILLQYQINLSQLLSLTQVTSGGNSIQAPNIATQSLQQQAYVHDGQTIVLFGFDQDRSAKQVNASVPSGVSRDSNSDHEMTVIVMEVSGGK